MNKFFASADSVLLMGNAVTNKGDSKLSKMFKLPSIVGSGMNSVMGIFKGEEGASKESILLDAKRFFIQDYQIDEVCVVYDNNNLDSCLAVAMLVACGFVAPTNAVPYHRIAGIEQFSQAKAYLFLGSELTGSELASVYNHAQEVTVLSYEGGYVWYAESVKTPKLAVLYPHTVDSDNDRPVNYNSISHMVLLFMQRHEYERISNFAGIVTDVASYINFLPLSKPIGSEFVPLIAASLYNLKEKLGKAFSSSDMKEQLVGLFVQPDLEGYMSEYRLIREDFKRNNRKMIFGSSQKRLMVLVMNIHETKYHEYARNVLMSESSFVGYFDTPKDRVWRVYCKDQSHVSLIEAHLKPKSVWMEGPVKCMSTDLPNLSF